MVAEGHTVVSLTGGVEGQKRDEIIDKFRQGDAKVLITTNVLARGIDVQTVSMVINYVRCRRALYFFSFSAVFTANLALIIKQDIPELHAPKATKRIADAQTYLHRIGRTGRFGRVGVAVSFVASKEEWQMLQDIKTYFNTEIQRVNTQDWDEVEEVVKTIIRSSRAGSNFQRS